MFSAINKVEIVELLKTLDKTRTRVYLGCDSQRLVVKGKPVADYAMVLVVHRNGNQGCKIFGDVVREPDYDKKDNPSVRLLNEAVKVAGLYEYVKDIIDGFEVEIHLDLNPAEQHKSSKVVSQAVGYIMGMCNIKPMIKPSAFCATFAADRFKEIREYTQ